MCSVTRGSQVGGKHWSSVISRRNSLINRLLKLVTVSPRSFARLIICKKRQGNILSEFLTKGIGKEKEKIILNMQHTGKIKLFCKSCCLIYEQCQQKRTDVGMKWHWW